MNLNKPVAELMRQTGPCRAGALVAVVTAALALGGCGGNSVLPDLTKEREKPAVDANLFPQDYKRKVRDTLRQNLTNPKDVRDGSISEPVLKPLSGTTRYVVCVRYNEKSGNAYLGVKESAAIFLSGEVTQFIDSTRELCGNAVYQRFPEIESNT
ncbi:MAG: hypothetical protein AB1490_03050 [Pseudomonadota bacterium]